MCGRYVFDADAEPALVIMNYIEQRFGPERAAKIKTGEICPTDLVPVLLTAEADPILPAAQEAETYGSSQLIALPMIWGFPGFRGSQVLINARQETVEEKPTFSEAFKTRRCVIPTTGFIEWSHDDNGKAVDKFRFNALESPMLFLAGIYTLIEDEMRFVILTTRANSSMADIHNRQPVILPRQMIRPWISDLTAANELRQTAGPLMVKTLLK